MLKFTHGMDPHSLNIVRDNKNIGFLQWHSDRSPRVILHEAMEFLSFSELKQWESQ